MLGDFHGKQHIADFRIARLPAGHAVEVIAADPAMITALGEEPACNRFHDHPRCRRVRHRAGEQEPQIGFFRQHLTRCIISIRGDDNLGENRCDLPRHSLGEGAIERDDPAKCADRISPQRSIPGLFHRIMAGHTAGVGVLDDGDARGIKLCHQLKGGIGIVDVVIA